jgi:4'-phosphopantetheinyl transferase
MISVWSANVSSDRPGALESRCQRWLTAEEIERADRFRVWTARNQHVVGRGMARWLLSRESTDQSDRSANPKCDPTEIVFSFTQYGKPYVIAPELVAKPFNVAHTDGMVLFADACDGVIGIDVERVSRRTDVALAERYFAKSEVEYVMDHHGDEQKLRAFLRVWTLKESFIKAIGTGLSMPLADFAFENIDDRCPQVRMLNPRLNDGRRWYFETFSPGQGYVAAIALGDADIPSPMSVHLRRFESIFSTDDSLSDEHNQTF